MPRTPIKPSVKVESRPYPSSSPPSNDSDANENGSVKKTKGGRGGKGSVWTGEEQKQLLHFALNRNGRGWGEAVPGKSANQASCLWSKKILPFLEKALEERAK